VFTQTLYERDSLPIPVVQQTLSNTTVSTAALDMSKFNRAAFIVAVGTGGPAPVVRAWLGQTNNANGSSPTNFNNASGVQKILTNTTFGALTNNVNTLECSALELTARYVVCTVQESAAIQTNICVVAIGTEARNNPANTNDSVQTGQRVF
jgi:hypothetical protein